VLFPSVHVLFPSVRVRHRTSVVAQDQLRQLRTSCIYCVPYRTETIDLMGNSCVSECC
jgi:hypothetical protein